LGKYGDTPGRQYGKKKGKRLLRKEGVGPTVERTETRIELQPMRKSA